MTQSTKTQAKGVRSIAMQMPEMRFLERFNGPSIKAAVTLCNPITQNLFKRTFDYLSLNLHHISIMAPILLRDQEEKVEKLNAQMQATIHNATVAITKVRDKYQKMVEEAGITQMSTNNAPRVADVTIVNPMARKYVTMLELLDEAILPINTLWMNERLTDKEYSALLSDLSYNVKGVPLGMRTIYHTVRKAATAKLRSGELSKEDLPAEVQPDGAEDAQTSDATDKLSPDTPVDLSADEESEALRVASETANILGDEMAEAEAVA